MGNLKDEHGYDIMTAMIEAVYRLTFGPIDVTTGNIGGLLELVSTGECDV